MLEGRKKIFIDMSMENELSRKLVEEENPDVLVASHYHLDHSLWLRKVNLNGREVWVPEGEEGYFSDIERFLDGTVGPDSPFREGFRSVLLSFLRWKKVEGFTSYGEISVDLGNFTLEVIRIPGHSPGHSAFYIPEKRILFAGDIGVGKFGPWYGWRDCSIPAYIESVKKLMDIPARILISAHDGIFEEPKKALEGVLEKLVQREEMIARALEEGKSKEEIIEEGIYFKNKHKIPEPQRTFITVQDSIMLYHHLQLLKEGGVKKLL